MFYSWRFELVKIKQVSKFIRKISFETFVNIVYKSRLHIFQTGDVHWEIGLFMKR